MQDLNYQLKQLCERNRDGSHATQAQRHQILQHMADQLHAMGYRRMEAKSLKPKHVESLITRYQDEGLSSGTIKNRLAHLRWWAEKINKQNVIARDNAHYGIAPRELVSNESKAQELDEDKLSQIKDGHIKASLELQKAFGLRREEAIKFIPSYADQGKFIQLKATWCKGGKARTVPVRTDEQREVLDRARLIAGKGSLIPPHLKYIEQLRVYEKELAKVGLSKMHGLRHRYAQQRYQELVGRPCPACGGLSSKDLSEEDRLNDKVARYAISAELGHERLQITSVYLGS